MRDLRTCRLIAVLVHYPALCRARPGHNATPAVKTGAAGSGPEGWPINIYIAYNSTVYPKYRGIVSESAPAPHATIKAIARITKAIINTAVKTYMACPIATMKQVNTIVKTPVRRGP